MELADHPPSTRGRVSDFKDQEQAGNLKIAYTVARSNSFCQSSPKVEDVVMGRIAIPQLSCNESLASGYCSLCQVIKTSSERMEEGSNTVLPTSIYINTNMQERSMCRAHHSVLSKPSEAYGFYSKRKHAEKRVEKHIDVANVDNHQTVPLAHRNAMLSAFTAIQKLEYFEASSQTPLNLEKEMKRLPCAVVGCESPREANSWEAHSPKVNANAYGCFDEAYDDIDLLMSSSDEEADQFITERFTSEVNEYAYPVSPSTYSSANEFFPASNYRRIMVIPETDHDCVGVDSPKLLSHKSAQLHAKAKVDSTLHCKETLVKVRKRQCPDTSHTSSNSRYHLASTVSGSARKARRNQVKRTFDLLRRIIPRGNTQNDRALVLDEAIAYLSSLQVKVQELESSRSAQSQRTIITSNLSERASVISSKTSNKVLQNSKNFSEIL